GIASVGGERGDSARLISRGDLRQRRRNTPVSALLMPAKRRNAARTKDQRMRRHYVLGWTGLVLWGCGAGVPSSAERNEVVKSDVIAADRTEVVVYDNLDDPTLPRHVPAVISYAEKGASAVFPISCGS